MAGDLALKQFQFGLEGVFGSASSVYGGGSPVVATRRLATLRDVGADWDLTFEAPAEARGNFAGIHQHIHHMQMAKGKVPAEVYMDDLYYYLKLCVSGTPTFTTLPNAPQTLLAATAIAATMPSLTTQPNATSDAGLAKLIQLTLANTAPQTTAVNVTVAGTDIYGNAISEVVAFTAGTTTPSKSGGGAGATSCTLWTKQYFATVTSITTSVQPALDTLAVAGVNAFRYVYVSDMSSNTLYTATGEYFDGAAAWQLPGLILNKIGLDAEIGKSFKLNADFMARDKIPLVATASSVNPAAQAGSQGALTNLADNKVAAMPTTLTRFYADNLGVAAGTTQIPARLTNFKWELDAKTNLGKAADGTPNPTFVSRGYYGEGLKASFALLMLSGVPGSEDPYELNAFLNKKSRTVRCAFPGVYLPCGALNAPGNWDAALQDQNGKGGVYGLMIDIAGKYTKAPEKAIMDRTGLEFELASEVDQIQLLAPMVFTIISRVNPNM
jgi:hypothetical protein